MTAQLAIPPSYVWDRIEKILDEQDSAKRHTERLIYDTFSRDENRKRNKIFFAALTSISLLTFIIWNRSELKKQLI